MCTHSQVELSTIDNVRLQDIIRPINALIKCYLINCNQTVLLKVSEWKQFFSGYINPTSQRTGEFGESMGIYLKGGFEKRYANFVF